jgi:dTDP-glucose 4,6-dehydratase
MKAKRVVITGGAGFIGASLAQRMLNGKTSWFDFDGKIVIYDSMSRQSPIFNLIKDDDRVEVIEHADVLNYSHMREHLLDCDVMVHCAAIAGIFTVTNDPIKTMDVCVNVTLNAAWCAYDSYKKGILKRFVDFSTSEIFGKQSFHSTEKDSASIGSVGESRWTYAIGKLASEHLTHSFYSQYGMPTVVVRPFNIFGPNQIGDGALKTFIIRALQNKPIYIHGDGSQIRSWCYIEDFLDGLDHCIENDKAIGEYFNIGNPRNTVTIFTLANMVKRIVNPNTEITFVNKDYVDIELRIPNIDKMKTLFGFEPQDALEDCIETIAWQLQNNEQYAGLLND